MKQAGFRKLRSYLGYAALAASIGVSPQTALGQVSGRVTDSSGLAVPDASISLYCSGSSASLKTDGGGRFYFPSPSSNCTLSVAHSGFSSINKTLSSGEATVELQLQLAPLKQEIDVRTPAGADPLLSTSIASVYLPGAELSKISNDTADLIRYAKLLAGALAPQDVIQVDGLPAPTLPPAESISSITVNANPFSAQYAEGNANFIDIVTRPPDRKFRFNFGGSPPGAGARDGILPSARSDSKSGNLRLSGPVFSSPLTFALRAGFSNAFNETPLLVRGLPDLPGTDSAAAVYSRSTSRYGSLDLSYFRESFQALMSYSENRGSGRNQGAGGLTLAESGFATSSAVRSARMSLTKSTATLRLRSGVVAGQRYLDSNANSEAAGLFIPGTVVRGGAALAASQTRRTEWNWTTTVEPLSQQRPWIAGVAAAGTIQRDKKTPNASGTFEFESLRFYNDALEGSPSARWRVLKGHGNAGHQVFTAAPFIQGTLKRTPRAALSGGMRVEYQAGLGTLVSPRLAMATAWKRLVFRAGGGHFIRPVANEIYMKVVSAGRLREYVVPQAFLQTAPQSEAQEIPTVRYAVDPALTRARETMIKASVEADLRPLNPAVEYTWTRGRHLPGSRRVAGGSGWLDTIGSNSLAERHELHGRVGRNWRRITVAAHYNWIDSHDTGDGPFAYPELQDDVSREWAPTTGISTHNVSLIGTAALPAAISLSATHTYRGSAPFNVTTGLDPLQLGLYNDRGGRSRNTGTRPGQNLTSLYLSRRVALPQWSGKLHMNIGVQVDNAFGAKNFIGLGSVIGSPLYGKPVGAYPGRSLRFWFNFD